MFRRWNWNECRCDSLEDFCAACGSLVSTCPTVFVRSQQQGVFFFKVERWVRTAVLVSGGKNRERFGSIYYANVLMFYLEGGFSLADVTKHWKGMFLFSFFMFHWLYLSVILCSKPYYAWHGEAAFLTVIYHCLFWVLSALRHLQRLPLAVQRFSSFNEVSFGWVCWKIDIIHCLSL